MNKYEKLVEEINKKEAIVEQKDNLAEQLSQITKYVNVINSTARYLGNIVDDIKEVTQSAIGVSLQIDTAVNLITHALDDEKNVVVQHKLDDTTIKQLTNRYNEYLKAESEILKKHHQAMQTMLKQNIVECREVVHESDGIYFSRKQSLWLLISYMTFFGIIIVEIFYFVTKLLE